MPQGRMKVKVSKPMNQVKKELSKKKKSGSAQKKNRPALPKHDGNTLRAEITKCINETNENSAKERASLDGKSFRVIPSPISITPSTSTTSKLKKK